MTNLLHSMRNMKQLMQALVVAVSLLLPLTGLAQTDPRETLQISIESLVEEFSTRRAEFEADRQKLYDFAERAIDDNWDFAKMAQLVLGKNWRHISEDQKTRFTEAFKDLLIRTYSTTMFKYTGKEAITLEEPIYRDEKKKRAVVNAKGDLGDGSEPIPLSFSMFLDTDDTWRIYNVTAAGISLVTTYRSSYGQIIAAKGIESLIDSLNESTEG